MNFSPGWIALLVTEHFPRGLLTEYPPECFAGAAVLMDQVLRLTLLSDQAVRDESPSNSFYHKKPIVRPALTDNKPDRSEASRASTFISGRVRVAVDSLINRAALEINGQVRARGFGARGCLFRRRQSGDIELVITRITGHGSEVKK